MTNDIEEIAAKIRLYFDTGAFEKAKYYLKYSWLSGITTNPTLLRSHGATDYLCAVESFISLASQVPISLPVIGDSVSVIEQEALYLASLNDNLFIKIPIMTTKGEPTLQVIQKLANLGVKVNITCLMTKQQVCRVVDVLPEEASAILSIFAGRIADTGRDPCKLVRYTKDILQNHNNAQVLWASTREVLNIFQAAENGCDVITLGESIMKKLPLLGYDLCDFSLETVKMFRHDVEKANYHLEIADNLSC